MLVFAEAPSRMSLAIFRQRSGAARHSSAAEKELLDQRAIDEARREYRSWLARQIQAIELFR